jgi:hypothetical protein
MNKYYAGIGSRETPKDYLDAFELIGEYLAKKDYILRSGAAQGADQAFERGCDKANGKKEIYLPWFGFEGSKSSLVVTNTEAFEIASKYHPRWDYLSQGAQKLQARNSYQVLGWNLNMPSQFIICWTKGGKGQGGTGQAIRIAQYYNIPILDAGNFENIEDFKDAFNKFWSQKKSD